MVPIQLLQMQQIFSYTYNAVIGVELALVPLLYMEPLNIGLTNELFWVHQIFGLFLLIVSESNHYLKPVGDIL